MRMASDALTYNLADFPSPYAYPDRMGTAEEERGAQANFHRACSLVSNPAIDLTGGADDRVRALRKIGEYYGQGYDWKEADQALALDPEASLGVAAARRVYETASFSGQSSIRQELSMDASRTAGQGPQTQWLRDACLPEGRTGVRVRGSAIPLENYRWTPVRDGRDVQRAA